MVNSNQELSFKNQNTHHYLVGSITIALLLESPDTTLCRTVIAYPSKDTANVACNGWISSVPISLRSSERGTCPPVTRPVIMLGNHTSWVISRLALTYLRSMLTFTDISLAQSSISLGEMNIYPQTLDCPVHYSITLPQHGRPDHGLSNSLTISPHAHSLGYRRLYWLVYSFPIQIIVPLRALFNP